MHKRLFHSITKTKSMKCFSAKPLLNKQFPRSELAEPRTDQMPLWIPSITGWPLLLEGLAAALKLWSLMQLASVQSSSCFSLLDPGDNSIWNLSITSHIYGCRKRLIALRVWCSCLVLMLQITGTLMCHFWVHICSNLKRLNRCGPHMNMQTTIPE